MEIREEFPWRHGESLGELYDILQRHVPFTPLYSTDIIAMQSRSFSQFFLRVASLIA